MCKTTILFHYIFNSYKKILIKVVCIKIIYKAFTELKIQQFNYSIVLR